MPPLRNCETHEDTTSVALDVPLGQVIEVMPTIYLPEKEVLGVVALGIEPE